MKVKRFFKAYFKGIGMEFSNIIAYRTAFILNSMSLIIGSLFGPLVALVIYSVSQGFLGWTLSQVLIFFGTIEIIMGLSHLLTLGLSWRTADLVMNGTLDGVLTKPLGVTTQILIKAVDYDGVIQVITGAVISLIGILGLSEPVTFIGFIYYLIMILDGFLLWTAISMMIGAASIRFLRAEEFFTMFWGLADFAKYPMNIYDNVIQFIMTFIFPLGVMSYYPSQFLLGRLNDLVSVLTLSVITLLFFGFALKIFRKALRYYESAGG